MGSLNRKPSRPGGHALADAVVRLSRLLTKERELLPTAYLRDAELRKAYSAYFLPPNLAKIGVPLRELDLHTAGLLRKPRLTVLDLGSGPGTAMLGVREYFKGAARGVQLECMAVDQVAENLREAEVLFRERAGGDRDTLTTVRSGIEAVAGRAGGTFDLVLFSNVLNELYGREPDRTARRAALVSLIMKNHLAPDGACIIIEPALRETSRDLLLVRDTLVDGGLTVYAPCLVQGRCPALEGPKDWCHEDRPWDPPADIREIDRLAGLRKDSLKFSYLVLRRDGRSFLDACGAGAFRVVSEPLVSKGKRELFLCGREGRRIASRLDKDAVPGNAAYEHLVRGDAVRFGGLAVEERRFRITKDTTVERVPPPRQSAPERRR